MSAQPSPLPLPLPANPNGKTNSGIDKRVDVGRWGGCEPDDKHENKSWGVSVLEKYKQSRKTKSGIDKMVNVGR